MGCFGSRSADVAAVGRTGNADEKHRETDPLNAGHQIDDKIPDGHFFSDYRGIKSSTAFPFSKARSDEVCIWADKVLAVREKVGDFVDPEDPNSWTPEVQDYWMSGN